MRRWAIVAVAISVAVAAILIVVELEISETEALTIIPTELITNGDLGARNFSVQFYLDRPGHLSGSWENGGSGTYPFTSYLFRASSCNVGNNAPGPYDVRCSGTPLWAGQSNVRSQSFNYSAGSGTYRLVWENATATASPFVVLASPLILHPTPWWWA
ncbi:MAG: hypothetical protein L3K18_07840 [Thermoplasmata archaeon]|nr:hypothetical protein [Thermoplasmata archaeon]